MLLCYITQLFRAHCGQTNCLSLETCCITPSQSTVLYDCVLYGHVQVLDQTNQAVINSYKHKECVCVCVVWEIIRKGGCVEEVNPVKRVSDSVRKPKTLNA